MDNSVYPDFSAEKKAAIAGRILRELKALGYCVRLAFNGPGGCKGYLTDEFGHVDGDSPANYSGTDPCTVICALGFYAAYKLDDGHGFKEWWKSING